MERPIVQRTATTPHSNESVLNKVRIGGQKEALRTYYYSTCHHMNRTWNRTRAVDSGISLSTEGGLWV